MKYSRVVLLSVALIGAVGVAAGSASAQPMPPPPPGMPAPPMMGDLHVRIVQTAPPERRHEVRSDRPDSSHTWVKGYWHHSGQEWAWSDGRWAQPPARHAHWVGARYQKYHGQTRYIPGHWSNQKVIYN
jgi:hypothetical protein